MAFRPCRALRDQVFPFRRPKPRDLAGGIQFLHPVLRRHRPRAQLREPAGKRDVDQPGRRQAPGFQSVRHRRAEQEFDRLPGKSDRVPVVLQLRDALPRMDAPDDGGLLDTVSGPGGRHCQYRAVISLRYACESLHAGPVGQPAQKPHLAPHGTRKRGEQAAAPGVAERRIQQGACRIRRYPVPDQGRHG